MRIDILASWCEFTQRILHGCFFFFHIGSQWGFHFKIHNRKSKHDILHSGDSAFRTLPLRIAQKRWVSCYKNRNREYFTKQKKKNKRKIRRPSDDNRELCTSPAPTNYIERTKFFSFNTQKNSNRVVSY